MSPFTAILFAVTAFFATYSLACSSVEVKHTFYGAPDNDPPGDATAYNCGGRNFHAGGSGSFNDPVTFASKDFYNECEVIYVPYLKKYARREDFCAACTANSGWIDIWTGTNANGGQAQIDCEDHLTPDSSHSIVRQPANNLPVDATPLWNGNTCTGHTFNTFQLSDFCAGSSVEL